MRADAAGGLLKADGGDRRRREEQGEGYRGRQHSEGDAADSRECSRLVVALHQRAEPSAADVTGK